MKCPICDTPAFRIQELWECPTCSHVWADHLIDQENYTDHYWDKFISYPLLELAYFRYGILRAFSRPGKLLDIGAGLGAFGQIALAGGYDVWYFDITNFTVPGRFITLEQATQQEWDVITCFDSLEHVQDFSVMKNLFAKSRLLYVSTPWRPSWFPQSRKWRHFRPEQHWHYFNPNSLSALIQQIRPDMKCCLLDNPEDVVRIDPANSPNILTAIFTSLGQ